METFKVYKHETVTSVAEIEAGSLEQAIRFARVSEGMPNAPEFTEHDRRNARYSTEESTSHKFAAEEVGEEPATPTAKKKSPLPFKQKDE